MHFISANNEISKVIFNPKEEKIALGDFIKFNMGYNRFVVSLVTKIKTIKENDKFNLAISKSILMIDEDIAQSWNGEVPAPKTKVEKIPLNKILALIKTSSKNILIGKNNEDGLYSSVDALKQNNFIFADTQQEKVSFVKSLTSELLKNNQKAIIFDFKGEFSFEGSYKKLTATDDFKLLLNANTIDAIYEQGLKEALIVTRAVIEDVFVEIKNYLKEDENNFIPFESFKDVIASEKSVPQLTLLKNQLDKYKDQNIFANSKEEFDILKNSLQENNLVVIDFSSVSQAWIKEFLKSVLNLNFEIPTFAFIDIQENIIDEETIDFLVKEKEEKTLYPIFSLGYSSSYMEKASYYAQNLFLFSPNIFIKNFPEYSTLLSGLFKDEFLAILDESNNIPFKLNIQKEVKLPTIAPKQEVIEEQPQVEQQKVSIDNIFEKELEPETPQEVDVSAIENEEEFIQKEEPQEVVEYNNEDDFDFDELDLDFMDEDVDNKQEQSLQAGQTEIYNEVEVHKDDDFELIQEEDDIVEEISDEVESLYTMPQETSHEEQEDFSNNDLPIYQTPQEEGISSSDIKEGDDVSHQKYGIGVVKKMINYGDKTLLSIQFDKAGRRLLDPNLAELEKINAG